MKCPNLRHKITIQSETRTSDGAGGWDRTWTNFANARAEIKPLRGAEQFRAMNLEDSITHKITIRYRSGITSHMRIVFGTRIMNIRSVINIDERNRWLEIMADEGVAT